MDTLSQEQALELAKQKVTKISIFSHMELKIMPEYTRKFEYGWVYFYQSALYVDTKDVQYLAGGNSPLIVDKFTSKVIDTGTRRDIGFYIHKYCELRDDLDRFYEEIRK